MAFIVGIPSQPGGDPFPVPLASVWDSYCDARHGIVYNSETGAVISWTSRVGSAVYTPPGNAPVYDADGSSTSGPTVIFTSANSEYFTTTNSAVISCFAGNDIPCTVVFRAYATANLQCFWCACRDSTSYYFFGQRGSAQYNTSKRAGDTATTITAGSFTTEQTISTRHTGTATQNYAGGAWQTETAQDNNTLASITTFAVGAWASSTPSKFLNGRVTAFAVASTTLSTADCETAMTAMAAL
jgi:hypothetical protein